jgi:hypothetical protein
MAMIALHIGWKDVASWYQICREAFRLGAVRGTVIMLRIKCMTNACLPSITFSQAARNMLRDEICNRKIWNWDIIR